MKNIISLALIALSINYLSAQRYAEINERLNKLGENRVWDSGIIDANLQGKNFSTIKNEGSVVIQKILQFEENNKFTLIELKEDKKTDQKSSNIFSGDLIKNDNNISVRADKLEGNKIAHPISYSFILQRRNGVLYLHNINNNEKWRESKIINQQ